MKEAIYRRHRPQSFDDLFGQEIIKKIFRNTIKLNIFSHAYIFTGERGSGKTTTARLIAKAVNCLDTDHLKNNLEPCNTCKNCESISKNSFIDVIEIDAASNRGIEDIKDLKEKIQTPPLIGKKKVVILDEAHMLTKFAWNALLKILEEPPQNSIIILATTEFDSIPKTIISRSQCYSLEQPNKATIFQKLKSIKEKDSLTISDSILHHISLLAKNSFRDGESLLDQVLSFENNSDEEILSILYKVNSSDILELALNICQNNLENSLNTLKKITSKNVEVKDILENLINFLRKALMIHLFPNSISTIEEDLTDIEKEKIQECAKVLKKDTIRYFLILCIKNFGEIKNSPFRELVLELTIIESLQNKTT